MCWNPNVSIKTWYFALFGFIIGFIAKKIHISVLLFALLFSSIQLIEYYLWKNINNQSKNEFYSKIGYIVILLEPLFALFMVYSLKIYGLSITKFLITFYIIYIILFTYTKYNKTNFITRIGDNGHLDWYFLKNSGNIHLIIWFVIFFFGIIMTKNIFIIGVAGFAFIYSLYKSNYDSTFTSLWCNYSNLLWIYIIIRSFLI